jgi:3-deoxy-7-phosphoheptulonate synthase
VRAIEARGFKAHPIPGAQRTAIGITGNRGAVDRPVFESLPGVLEVIPVTHAYKLVSREVKPEDTVVRVGDVAVGGRDLVVAAGPCAVESLEQMLIVARGVKAAGARLLRGGAFKPRTSPYSFQGLGEEGLRILAAAREETGLPVVTEALDAEGSTSWSAGPTASRSAPATCRTSRCCGAAGRRASPCSSSVASPRRSRSS